MKTRNLKREVYKMAIGPDEIIEQAGTLTEDNKKIIQAIERHRCDSF